MTSAWNDPMVAQTLRGVVDDLGRLAALDPARLRAALNDTLGSRAHEFRAQVDALVVAVEEDVPQGMLADEPAIDLGDRLTSRGTAPEVAGWVLAAWAHALRLGDATAAVPMALPPVVAPKPPPAPLLTAPPTAPPAAPPTAPPTGPPAAPPTGPPADDAQAPDDGPRSRRGLLVLVAGVVAILLVGGGIVLATRGGGADQTAKSPVSASPAATSASSATSSSATSSESSPGASPSGSGAAVAPARVLAHEGGGETFAEETVASLVDAATRGYTPETDVRWTSDNVPILIHNPQPTTPMVCARNYTIAETSWATLRTNCRTAGSASKDGKRYPIPTFADAVAGVAAVSGAQLFTEVKIEQSAAQVDKFYSIIADNDMLDRVVVTSFLPGELAKMKAEAKASGQSLRLMQFVRDRKLSGPAAAKAGLWGVAVRSDQLTSAYVGDLRASGLKVIVWTINDPSAWSAARKLDVDHVLTDKPGGYEAWLASR